MAMSHAIEHVFETARGLCMSIGIKDRPPHFLGVLVAEFRFVRWLERCQRPARRSGTSPESRGARMSARHWLLGAGLIVTAVGCGTQGVDNSSVSKTPASEGAPGSRASSSVDVGETVSFTMYTRLRRREHAHQRASLDAVEPLCSSSERLGPPAGWGHPEQVGRLT